MSKDESVSKEEPSGLLNQFELILDSDPLIDEIGFIHECQFATLNKEAESNVWGSKDEILIPEINRASRNFWNKDHKLGLSLDIIIPLYKAAKDAFFIAITQFKRLGNSSLEDEVFGFSSPGFEVMKHSRALLLLSCDFGTAWNARKLILSKKQYMPMFSDELLLSALVLSYSPKSEQAWCHRRWVIKMIAGKCSTMQDILGKESELVEKIAEQSKMNYRAWNHRCWLVSYMGREQVLLELKRSRKWAGLHVADNSCFHYRMRLMHRILEKSCHKPKDASSDHGVEISQIWEEELQWNEELIKQYVGREALWLYRRFLSLCWIRHFATSLSNSTHQSEHKSHIAADIKLFLDYELCLVNTCSTVPDHDFEDFQAQTVHSATYILWLTKKIPKSQGIDLKNKLNAGSWKAILNAACPEKSSLWDNLANYVEASK